MAENILTIREVAELLKINEKTVYKLAADAKIPGFKVGGSWRFDGVTIAKWIDGGAAVGPAAISEDAPASAAGAALAAAYYTPSKRLSSPIILPWRARAKTPWHSPCQPPALI